MVLAMPAMDAKQTIPKTTSEYTSIILIIPASCGMTSCQRLISVPCSAGCTPSESAACSTCSASCKRTVISCASSSILRSACASCSPATMPMLLTSSTGDSTTAATSYSPLAMDPSMSWPTTASSAPASMPCCRAKPLSY